MDCPCCCMGCCWPPFMNCCCWSPPHAAGCMARGAARQEGRVGGKAAARRYRQWRLEAGAPSRSALWHAVHAIAAYGTAREGQQALKTPAASSTCAPRPRRGAIRAGLDLCSVRDCTAGEKPAAGRARAASILCELQTSSQGSKTRGVGVQQWADLAGRATSQKSGPRWPLPDTQRCGAVTGGAIGFCFAVWKEASNLPACCPLGRGLCDAGVYRCVPLRPLLPRARTAFHPATPSRPDGEAAWVTATSAGVQA